MATYIENHKLNNVVGTISEDWSRGVQAHLDELDRSPINRTSIQFFESGGIKKFLSDIDLSQFGGLTVECTKKTFRWPGLNSIVNLGEAVDLAHPVPARIIAHSGLVRAARIENPSFGRHLANLFSEQRNFVQSWLIPASQITLL